MNVEVVRMAKRRSKVIERIGVLTGGGDCPGLNAVIRAVGKTAIHDYGLEVIGILDGFDGFVNGRMIPLQYKDVSGILTLGGTILGSSNRANPFKYAQEDSKKRITFSDRSEEGMERCRERGIDALVCIGGDGTLSIAHELMKKGMAVVGVPKTIDNDLCGTDFTFGFDTAVSVATEAIDRIHTTAMSHHRIMVVEVMGRYAGWLALYSGVAGGGDVILIPEIPYDLDVICDYVKRRGERGKKFSIIVVAEGAKPTGGDVVVKRKVKGSHDPIRLGGVGHVVARQVEEKTGQEARVTVLGHIQRGGSPTARDRILATQFGHHAVQMLISGKMGYMSALKGYSIRSVPLAEAVSQQRNVPPNCPLIGTARSVGTCFGDE